LIDLNKYDYIIFDCDGVILESNKLKSDAFAEALPNEPTDLVAEFVQYHKQNGGISRYEKFRYYFEEMKKQVEAEAEIDKALNNFTTIVSEGLLKCNFIPGVVEIIRELFNLNKRLFVVSGSDEKELIQVFKQRGIDHYFENIYGSPDNKVKNTRKVISPIITIKNGLFFGDSKSDYRAAIKFGLDFIFVSGFSEWGDGLKINKYEGNLIIKDFREII
jgi:phosphoglycolate phosphatase-like HAD superfamily hydrolase